jgi:hypothetical protein
VARYAYRDGWRAYGTAPGGKTIHLGVFDSEDEAAAVAREWRELNLPNNHERADSNYVFDRNYFVRWNDTPGPHRERMILTVQHLLDTGMITPGPASRRGVTTEYGISRWS